MLTFHQVMGPPQEEGPPAEWLTDMQNASQELISKRHADTGNSSHDATSRLSARAVQPIQSGQAWARSQMSCPRGDDWSSTAYQVQVLRNMIPQKEYIAYWDDTYGAGQMIYIMENDVRTSHVVSIFRFLFFFFGRWI